MTTVNLLPWREEVRKIKNNLFFASVVVSIALSLLIVFSAHALFQCWINAEAHNIELIQMELKEVLQKIHEIQNLQKNKTELLRRREIIQSLEMDRTLLVRFLDVLPRIIPENIVLVSIERKESRITILGTAETPSSIAKFYSALEDPRWENIFQDIKINEMALEKKQTGVGFKLEFSLSNRD